jgi:hypothetical protein
MMEQHITSLVCADLDHLEFLPSGDAAVTRRASKYSKLKAVVLQWSRTRQRYERQGIPVETEAIEQAEKECLADADQRQRKADAIGVADLTTQSPPLAISLGEIIGANDPKATATKGHAESVASFQFFDPSTLWPLVGQSPLPLAPTTQHRAFLSLPTSPESFRGQLRCLTQNPKIRSADYSDYAD